jgi:FMN phosphatase YigB (HAD superfamily)
MVKGVIFDFWGTLVRFGGEEALYKMRRERAMRFSEELKNYGYDFTQEKILKILEEVRLECTEFRNNTSKEIRAEEVVGLILERLKVNKKKEICSTLTKIYSNTLFTIVLGLHDGVIEVLKGLKKSDLKIGLLSNTEHGNIEVLLLKNFNIYQYFDSLVFSCEIGIRKPSVKVFEYVINSLSLVPNESVYIGDWPEIDILGAKQSGMRAIFLNPYNVPYPKETPRPDAIIEKFSQIPKILEELS